MRLRTAIPYSALPFSFEDEEKAAEQLSSPFVHSSQFHCPLVGFSKTSPEAKLMYAVLEDAINCFRKRWAPKVKNGQRLAQEAAAWVFSDDLDWPFSFLNVCTVLGIDPDYLRRGLICWCQQPPAARPRGRRFSVPMNRPLRIAA
jgi:hypothetical protein